MKEEKERPANWEQYLVANPDAYLDFKPPLPDSETKELLDELILKSDSLIRTTEPPDFPLGSIDCGKNSNRNY